MMPPLSLPGAAVARPTRVLFLCIGNWARSQMAEGFARHYAGGKLEVYSAGTQPAPIRPEAIAVMHEVGIDISGQHSKGLDEVPEEVEVVVTLCQEAAEACPFFSASPRQAHWALPDPAAAQGTPEQMLEVYREVRDTVAGLVRALVMQLLEPQP